MRFREIGGVRHSELTLGTVQLGMYYGAVNDHGQPSWEQAVEIVRTASQCGVTVFDTARAYGDAEAVLGQVLVPGLRGDAIVITKLGLAGLALSASEGEVRARVDAIVDASCAALCRNSLDVLLLHGWDQHNAWGGAVWRRLIELRRFGKIKTLGASVYEPQEALAALRDPEIRHLQIPMNLLDWRWKEAGVDVAIAVRGDIAVHARSVLLQGILAHPAERWPRVADFDSIACARCLVSFAEQFDRESVQDLCFAYVRSLPWITSIVVGCETLAQLHENVSLFSRSSLTFEECKELERTVPRAPEGLLNPAKWQSRREVAYAS